MKSKIQILRPEKENFPVTIKNRTQEDNESHQNYLDSPIKMLRGSREHPHGSNPENQISKIEVVNQRLIEFPPPKNQEKSSNSQNKDSILEVASEKSLPLQSSLNKVDSPQKEFKRFGPKTPQNLDMSPKFQQKPQKPQIKRSYTLTDSILSPQFSKYLGNSQSQMKPRLRSPLYPHHGYHHNQYPLMVQSETLSKPQNCCKYTTLVRQELKLTLANNLQSLVFKYNGGHARALCNNKLKIKNDSPVNVELKIMCTSPSHYEIRPFSCTVLGPSQIMNCLIETKLYNQDINQMSMRHDLSRYQNDKFKICYWSRDYQPDIWYESGEKILPVSIEDTEDERIRSKGLLENQTNEEQKMITGQKNICMYKKMIVQTKRKIDLINFEIKDVNRNKLYIKYFTKSLFWLVTVIGFAIGYWLG